MDQFCFTPAKNEEKTWADHGTVNWVLTAIGPLKQTIIFNFLPNDNRLAFYVEFIKKKSKIQFKRSRVSLQFKILR